MLDIALHVSIGSEARELSALFSQNETNIIKSNTLLHDHTEISVAQKQGRRKG